MKCWKCGAENPPGARFCGSCGTDQQQAPPPEPSEQFPPEQQTPPPPGGGWTPGGPGAPGPDPAGPGGWIPNGGMPSGGNETVLKLFSLICAVIYGVLAVTGLVGTLGSLFSMLRYMSFWGLLTLLFAGLTILLNVWMCLVLVVTGLRRTPQNSDGLLILLGAGGAAHILVRLLSLIVNVIRYPYLFRESLGGAFPTVLGVVIVVGGVYAIRRFLLGETPLLGKTPDELQQEVRETLSTLGQTANEAAQGAKASWDASRQAQQPPPQQQQAQWQGQQPPPPYYGQPAPPPMGYMPYRLKTDRSLIAHILLCIITCGLYGWYFIYSIARDVNIACDGDGKQTAGLLKFILLNLCTCGIYSFFWYYGLGNRLAANAPRYGMNFQENGTTVLLWLLLGSWLCGIGFFVALHIIIKNTNALCSAYNFQHGI